MPDEPSSNSKIRSREVAESALGQIIGGVVLAFIGLAGGVTLGWIPAIIIVIVAVTIWYKIDPGLQRLVQRRATVFRQAMTSDLDTLPKWNVIANNALADVARENKLNRDYLQIAHRHILDEHGQQRLEMVLSYFTEMKWYLLVDSAGNIIDQYGGWAADVLECPNCQSPTLVSYQKDSRGEIVNWKREVTCRRCENSFQVTRADTVQSDKVLAETDVVVKEVKEAKVSVTSEGVFVDVEFLIENRGRAGKVCPYVEISIYFPLRRIEKKYQSDSSWVVEIGDLGTQQLTHRWPFTVSDVPLVPREPKVSVYSLPSVRTS
jgi:hypothetical protein